MKRAITFHLAYALLVGLSLVSCRAASPAPTVSVQDPTTALTRISYNFETRQAGTSTLEAANPSTPVPPPGTAPTPTIANTSPVISTHTPTPQGLAATATRTPNPAATRTNTPTKTPVTPTATLQTGWGGKWTVYYGEDDDDLTAGTMEVTLSGTTVNALATFGSATMTLSGELSADGKQVSGTFNMGAKSGWFYWKQVSQAQFGGAIDNQQAFCADRQGTDRPVPCLITIDVY